MSQGAMGMAVRSEDRRESPRVPMRLLVRRAGSGAVYEAWPGDLSLGGAAWQGGALEVGAEVELRFKLPSAEAELHARGEVLKVTETAEGPRTHVRFVELSMEAERAIARYLDDLALAGTGR